MSSYLNDIAKLAITLLKDYIEAKNSLAFIPFGKKQNHLGSAYGVDIYKYISTFHDMVIKHEEDYRILPVSVLLEHKLCVMNLIKYVENILKTEDRIVDFDEIVKKAEEIKLWSIKFKITDNTDILKRIHNYIMELEEKEPLVLKIQVKVLEERQEEL